MSKSSLSSMTLGLILLGIFLPWRLARADHVAHIRNPYTGQVYAVRARSPGEPGTPNYSSKPAPKRGQEGPAPLRFVAWQDPAESAFTVNVPQGWTVRGGTVRTTPVEPHYVVRAYAPDGGAMLFWDDPRLLTREVPNAFTRSLGYLPGQIMPSAWGGRLLLEPYEPAASAGLEYARQFLCRNPTRVEGGRIPDQSRALVQRFGPIAQAEGKQIYVDAGEVAFRCGDQVGYVYAITLLAAQPGTPAEIWLIYRLAGYMAKSADSATASAAINEMLATFRMNPQWLEAFARQTNDMAGNVIRESNAITQTTVQRAQEQNKELANENKEWQKNFNQSYKVINKTNAAITNSNGYDGTGNGHDYNPQLDTKTVCDSVGHCQTVPATHTYYWADCSGTMHPGPESGAPPPGDTSACLQRAQ